MAFVQHLLCPVGFGEIFSSKILRERQPEWHLSDMSVKNRGTNTKPENAWNKDLLWKVDHYIKPKKCQNSLEEADLIFLSRWKPKRQTTALESVSSPSVLWYFASSHCNNRTREVVATRRIFAHFSQFMWYLHRNLTLEFCVLCVVLVSQNCSCSRKPIWLVEKATKWLAVHLHQTETVKWRNWCLFVAFHSNVNWVLIYRDHPWPKLGRPFLFLIYNFHEVLRKINCRTIFLYGVDGGK